MTAFFSNLPPELLTMLVAATPVGELRAAIPFSILVLKLPVWSAVFWSLLGNSLPILLVFACGRLWLLIVEREKGFFHRLTDRVLRRTHVAFAGRYGKWGLVALTIFVAIPLPLTGAWSGALAAFTFGIPFRKAFPLIFVGNVISAAIVTSAVTGGAAIFRFFL